MANERDARLVDEPVVIYNAKIMFRNFSGEATDYNPKGMRNFCIFLSDDIARDLEEKGWTIKWLAGKDDYGPQGMISVRVAFGNFPPTIVLINQDRQSKLNEANVNILDWAQIDTCDVILNPYNWNKNGNQGVKAYLKSMYVTLKVDELAAKYDYHEGADEAIGGCGNCEVCDGECGSPLAMN